MNNYSDILNYPHYELRYHERMSQLSRAAQFASFDALMGFKEEIKEEGRLTSSEVILSEEEITLLNKQLQELQTKDKIKIIYFIPDKTKNGGSYQNKEGILKKIDSITQEIIFTDKSKIKLRNIIQIEKE